jgi:hypothetical protein
MHDMGRLGVVLGCSNTFLCVVSTSHLGSPLERVTYLFLVQYCCCRNVQQECGRRPCNQRLSWTSQCPHGAPDFFKNCFECSRSIAIEHTCPLQVLHTLNEEQRERDQPVAGTEQQQFSFCELAKFTRWMSCNFRNEKPRGQVKSSQQPTFLRARACLRLATFDKPAHLAVVVWLVCVHAQLVVFASCNRKVFTAKSTGKSLLGLSLRSATTLFSLR